jgi:hypothetical protein
MPRVRRDDVVLIYPSRAAAARSAVGEGQDNRDYELEVIAVKIAAGQEGFLLVMHVRPTDLPEEG